MHRSCLRPAGIGPRHIGLVSPTPNRARTLALSDVNVTRGVAAMRSDALEPIRVPAEFWQHVEVVATLEACDIGALFRLLRQYAGASQTRIGIAVGMPQSEVSLIMNTGPRQRRVTALGVLARIAHGLNMPDHARKHLGLAHQATAAASHDHDHDEPESPLNMPPTALASTLSLTARDTPWETVDLIERIQASDVSPQTLERLEATIFELCCQYPYRNAPDLHGEARGWLSRIDGFLRRPVGLHEHRELLASAGWLALLIGCLEYDQGMRSAADATRIAARQLGNEAGHGEIVAWSHEMSAWFALTQGRYANVVTAAEAGQSSDGVHSVQVQLLAQEAKALVRQPHFEI